MRRLSLSPDILGEERNLFRAIGVLIVWDKSVSLSSPVRGRCGYFEIRKMLPEPLPVHTKYYIETRQLVYE